MKKITDIKFTFKCDERYSKKRENEVQIDECAHHSMKLSLLLSSLVCFRRRFSLFSDIHFMHFVSGLRASYSKHKQLQQNNHQFKSQSSFIHIAAAAQIGTPKKKHNENPQKHYYITNNNL